MIGPIGLLTATLLSADCPVLRPDPSGPGVANPFHRPLDSAFRLNREGRDLYRQRRFSDARRRYQAALATDPAFLAPRINIVTALVQEGRFTEAVTEARLLTDLAFLPWSQDLLSSADLAPLVATPQFVALRRALDESARAWAAALPGAVFFLARTGPPVRVAGAGDLIFDLKQEILAWHPVTGRSFQLSHESGRVLAFLPLPNGHTLAYVTGRSLIRPAFARPDTPARLRGLALRLLDLRTMTLSPPLALPELYELSATPAGGTALRLRIRGPAGTTHHLADPSVSRLTALPASARPIRPPAASSALTLTAIGADSPTSLSFRSPCAFKITAARVLPSNPLASLTVRAPSGRLLLTLPAPFGAALRGFHFPDK